MRTMLSLLVAVSMLAGCGSRMVARPSDKAVDAQYTRSWADQIRREARDGDILLTRGYAWESDMIDVLTDGAEVSHSSIYDAERGMIIEAIGGGVREVPLENLVGRVHRVIVIRPAGGAKAGRAALLRARSAIGKPYDYTGLVGVDDPDKFYCSELVAWAWRAWDRGLEHDTVVRPSHMVGYGETVFDSGPREQAGEVVASN